MALGATKDPLAQLTITEVDSGSRLLKADLVTAITRGTVDRSKALAIVAFLHARRADPAAKLQPFVEMTYAELGDHLNELGGGDQDDDDDDDDEQLGEVDEIAADPTAPAAAPS